ncbi:hypothetical protein GEMRC1_004797 [Eukaryota sp. GEM-RC1]
MKNSFRYSFGTLTLTGHKPFGGDNFLDALLILSDDPGDKTGSHLWSGSLALSYYIDCNSIFSKSSLPTPSLAYELGTGTGLVSMVLSKYFDLTIATDSDTVSLGLAQSNYSLNKSQLGAVSIESLSWGDSVDDLIQKYGRSSLVLGGDILYDCSVIPLVFQTAKSLLDFGGMFIVSFVARDGSQSKSKLRSAVINDCQEFGFSVKSCEIFSDFPRIDDEEEEVEIFIFEFSNPSF